MRTWIEFVSYCCVSEFQVAQLYLTLCDPMDYTVHGILQARILAWVAFPFSRGSSQPRDQPRVSWIVGRFFTSWATRESQKYWSGYPIPSPVDLPDPGIEPGSPALQAHSLPTELWGKPQCCSVNVEQQTLCPQQQQKSLIFHTSTSSVWEFQLLCLPTDFVSTYYWGW